MDDSVMAAGFHPGSAIGIGDHDSSTQHRHHPHHLPQHMPSGVPRPQHPMSASMPGGGGLFDASAAQKGIALFDASAVQKGIALSPLGGSSISPSAAYTPSDDDEEPGDSAAADGGKAKKGSPWHRMKWTDDMVRLLIAMVSYVGDDGAPEAADARRRPGAALQKKGKWKEVSRLMLEKGCYVSPQQCEDKFNDLNKRYKRLNDILGRGTTCQVVENPSLLDSMPHVSAKAKEDVRKILSSKHLFYREMCAYHNGPRMAGSHDIESHGPVAPSAGSEDNEDDDDEDDDNGDEEGSDGFGRRACESLRAEVDAVLQDKTKSRSEQLEWFRERALQLLEDRVEIEAEALELEKRRFKWQRFRGKKDREMERLKLGNERLMLENERMVMQVRKKELKLDHLKSGESMESVGFRMDREQGRDLMELS